MDSYALVGRPVAVGSVLCDKWRTYLVLGCKDKDWHGEISEEYTCLLLHVDHDQLQRWGPGVRHDELIWSPGG